MGYVRAQRFVCLAPLVDVAVIQERLCWIHSACGHELRAASSSSSASVSAVLILAIVVAAGRSERSFVENIPIDPVVTSSPRSRP